MILPRRSFLIGLGAIITAPAIVRAESIMRVRVMRGPVLELIGLTGDCGDDGVGDIISSYSKRELEDIAARIMHAQIVIVR